MPTALLIGYPHHVRTIARFVNQHATRWKLLPEGTGRAARNRALTRLPFVDALVAFGGPGPDALLSAWMRRVRKPMAVVWAGSDVVEIRDDAEEIARVRARNLRHVACSAELADELSGLGIPATELCLVVAEQQAPLVPLPSRFSVLCYCPRTREELYGVDILLELIRRLPRVNFDVIGGYSGDVSAPNVIYHGWVDDIASMIDRATVIVRPTRHDGMPLMVLEALARGRHVIWSHPLDGVSHASSVDEIAAHIEALHASHDAGTLHLNNDGFKAVEASFSPAAVTRAVELFLDDLVSESAAYNKRFSSSRVRAVASGAPGMLASFIDQLSREAPHYEVHPLIGRSRSERLDDGLAVVAADKWFRLGDDPVDPILGGVARLLRKTTVAVTLEPGTALYQPRRKRRRATRIRMTSKEWRAFDACHVAPTFFARPAWASALEQTFKGLAAEAVLFRLPEGEALFPLTRSGKGLVSVKAMPLGTYTLPLRPDGEPADPVLAEAIVHDITGNDSADFSCTLWPLGGYGSVNGCNRTIHQTSVIDLRGGADAALARFKGVARRMAGQAVRKGVVCAREPESIGIYYGLLEEAAKRWGMESPHLPRRLFDAITAFGENDVEIWIARYKGEAIAGCITLYGSREAFVWSAAMRSEYADLRPSNLLNTEMIKAAVDRGMQWYNLGASEGLGGVARFKESLGSELVEYATLSWSSPMYRKYQRLRSALRPARSA